MPRSGDCADAEGWLGAYVPKVLDAPTWFGRWCGVLDRPPKWTDKKTRGNGAKGQTETSDFLFVMEAENTSVNLLFS